MPFSKQPESGDTEFGPPETGTQIFERAAARFNSALGAAISSDDANAARVGLGRALLALGRYSDAANAVNGVPADFAKFHRHSSNTAGQRNSIYELNVSVGRWSLGDSEGVNGLDFRTSGDPRITSALCPGCAFDTSEQVPGTPAVGDNWQLFNYTSRNDPVPLATGIEAWLIRAEAELQANNPGGWLDLLNQARQAWGTVAGIFRGDASGTLADLTDPGTATGRTDLHFRERAFWLFAQGQRLGDLRRMVRQYGYATDQIFPVGPYWKPGATYGTDVNFPVPVDEENNPNFTGCIDRAP